MAVPVAGACDVLENVALLRALQVGPSGLVVPVGSLLAATKFALLVLALLAIVRGLLERRRHHVGNR